MKERPILFSGPMVRAILEGRKTMTRRVIKPQPQGGINKSRLELDLIENRCPYGHIGDALWVRETFRLPSRLDDATPEELEAQASRCDVRFLADGETDLNGKTRPAIFLRYGWHRITLEIVSVRVELLREITREDILKEGAIAPRDCIPAVIGAERTIFAHLWDSINAKRGYGWIMNPWVWVVEFKRAAAHTHNPGVQATAHKGQG